MSKTAQRLKCVPLLAAGLALAACASSGPTELGDAQRELAVKQARLSELQSSLQQTEQALERSQSEVDQLSTQLARTSTPDVAARPPGMAGGDVLPNARPGECYAKVLLPAQYKTDTVRILKREASEKIEVIPPRYEAGEERVLVKPASQKLQVVPAQYGWAEEKVLVKPAHTVWKKGRGPVERIDNATGEIMCLVEVPAEYKTVKKRVLKTPETTRTVEIPAEYRTIKVRKLVEPARENRIQIPAQYETVTQRAQVSEERLEWRPVLCQTNTTPELIASLQRALAEAGHSPGPIDGRLGPQTLSAVQAFQRKKGLARGGVTLATLDALGVRIGR
jgi:hypothetical protein